MEDCRSEIYGLTRSQVDDIEKIGSQHSGIDTVKREHALRDSAGCEVRPVNGGILFRDGKIGLILLDNCSKDLLIEGVESVEEIGDVL